MKRKTNTKNIP